MTYVITQNCCNDASCVAECPVDCIRPTPDDRVAFAAAEMLYIDPDSCIDCGACMDACPVGAVAPEEDLPVHLARFAEFNAGYFLAHPLAPTAPSPRAVKPDPERGELSVAIVGAGPSGSYVTEELLERGNVRVSVYDSLPTPWGLLRSGVAPDHQHTKDLAGLFERTAAKKQVDLRLNVAVGTDVTVDDLLASHHAVVIATGAADPQPWDVPGADLSGVHPATDFVAWYNGHPSAAHLDFDLSGERAVIVGNGNVALDMARVLLMTPEQLNATDIASHALDKLENSNIREVVVLGRRGPLQAAYTSAEFHALASLDGVDVVVDAVEAVLDEASLAAVANGTAGYADRLKAILASECAASPVTGAARRLVFRFLREPARVLGSTRVEGLELAVNRLVDDGGRLATQRLDETETLSADLVLTSVGYRGRPIPGVPFDDLRGVVSNIHGRIVNAVAEPIAGLYATGWIRRGAQGGLGSSRLDAVETVDHIVADFNAAVLTDPSTPSSAVPGELSLSDWKVIDAWETQAGQDAGRPRIKLTKIEEMLAVARSTQ